MFGFSIFELCCLRIPVIYVLIRGVQNNQLTEKTDKTEEKLTGKTEQKKPI
jgi:hypothetical protein